MKNRQNPKTQNQSGRLRKKDRIRKQEFNLVGYEKQTGRNVKYLCGNLQKFENRQNQSAKVKKRNRQNDT